MKIRSGFVTNSSSSSFVAISIDNPVFAKIMQKYAEYFSEEGWMNIFVDEDSVEINIEEGYATIPSEKDDIVDAIIETLDYQDIECDDGEGNYEYDETNEDNDENLVKMIKEIREHEDEILEATEYIEFSCSDVGWQGDSESRYYQDNYDEETLKNIYETIAQSKGKSVDEVTDEDFGEYVSDKVSTETDTFEYNKETGEVTTYHSFEIE